MKPIVVVGSINMDLVSQTDRIPAAGETVLGNRFHTHPGGKGANQAVTVARLGYPCTLLGRVGDDGFGHELLATLKGYGVDISHVDAVAGASGTASIVVDRRGENTIVVVPGANQHVTPVYLEAHLDVLRGAAVVLAQLEIPVETVEWLVACCAELRVPIVLDPAPAVPLSAKLLSKVTWFTPNETEAAFYAGTDKSVEGMVRRLLALGVGNVILKQSSDGAAIACADGTRHKIGAFPVHAVDSTAAGDCFNGAFAVGLAVGKRPEESARFAAAAAAISVTRQGAQSSLPNAAEVADLLNRCRPGRAGSST